MIDPRRIDESETRRNGVSIRIRAVHPGDKNGIAQAFDRLDAESIYTRFFQAKEGLSSQELKAATEVDFEDVVALVATIQLGKGETIVGGGRYLVIDRHSAPRKAEIAFLIEEDYHGLGIAGRILKHLTLIAREKGVDQFEAEVLSHNKAMLTVFARSGLPVKRTQGDGVVHLSIDISSHQNYEQKKRTQGRSTRKTEKQGIHGGTAQAPG
jgi:RimJ/RimL family protein N-acetyltransferase